MLIRRTPDIKTILHKLGLGLHVVEERPSHLDKEPELLLAEQLTTFEVPSNQPKIDISPELYEKATEALRAQGLTVEQFVKMQLAATTVTKRGGLTLDSIMPFGKFNGHRIEYVLETDPRYMAWLLLNTDIGGRLTPETIDAVTERLTKEG